MALYTIGEVAVLCEVNPVTLRAWQRRYGLLKPQRTDGGHRLFNDSDIDRIREIKHWIENGVQVSKVKALLSSEASGDAEGWRNQQEALLQKLRAGDIAHLRHWISDIGRIYPAETLVNQLYIPLRRRLHYQQPTLHTLLSVLDGVLINYVALSLNAARKKPGKDALVVGWNVTDITRLWLVAWVATQQGWRVDILAHPLSQLRPELFGDKTVLVWCGDMASEQQLQQLARWRAEGHQLLSWSGKGTI